jgi:hypothetical protein
VIDLLAIADETARPQPPVRAVRSEGISVLCADAPAGELTADDLWRREALVEQLMEAGPLLPVRLNARVPDEAAVVAAVAGRGDELRARLEHVRGAVELAVRVQPAEPATGDLRALAARVAAADAVHAALAPLARDAVARPAPDLLRAAYLVDRERVDALVARVRELQQDHPDLAILCTGPWPPYSFAEPE